jgi:hypothetical protein
MQVLTSYFRPLTLIFPVYFGRFLLAVTFTIFALLSGFRSALMVIGIYIGLSSYFRRQARDLTVYLALGVVGLSILAIGNGRLFDLPLSAQRALSFLPGKWDYVAVADAKHSVDWRVEMWKMVWQEDKWIKNKLLGDGFGFTRVELAMMSSAIEGGVGFVGGAQQEAFMINGVFHNGPLSTIRFVGEVGLVLYYALMVLLAWRAVKVIRKTYGTDLFPAALFVGMPVLYYTVTFPVGVGQFDIDLPQNLFLAGVIKLVGRASRILPEAVDQPRAELTGRVPTTEGRRMEPAGERLALR